MNCPICNSNLLKEEEKFGNYTLYECNNCLVQFWWPLKHPGQEFYQTNELHEIKEKRKLQWRHKQFLKNPPIEQGRLLDIGCGPGEFLKAAQNLGFEVWGIDIAPRNIEAAQKFYNLKNIFLGTLEDFINQYPDLKFDIITFFEIVEHLDNPINFFKLIKRLLNPGGYIAMSVPNLERFGGPKEKEENPPNHLFRWRPSTIFKFLETQGFENIKVIAEPFSKDFFFVRGIFSLGLARKVGKDEKQIIFDKDIYATPLNILNWAAKIKNTILLPLALIATIPMRFLGYKYWDLYVVAKLK